MFIHAATLFQRPSHDADQCAFTPLLFMSSSLDDLISRIRAYVDAEFGLENNGDLPCQETFELAKEWEQLEAWFDEHYWYFQIQLHEMEV